MAFDKVEFTTTDGVSVMLLDLPGGVEAHKAFAEAERRRESQAYRIRLGERITEAKEELAVRKKGLAKWKKDGLMRKIALWQQNVDAKEQEIRDLNDELKELSDGND